MRNFNPLVSPNAHQPPEKSPGPRPRIALVGGVESSRVTLQRLLHHRADVVGVFGLDRRLESRTSGYARLDDLAQAAGVPYHDFVSVNDPAIVEAVRAARPDLLFVVGLSQLIRRELMDVPTTACVGFHPTRLPEGRGRAPVAWMTLERRPGAATFFVIDEGVDSGPVLVQEPFGVDR